MRWLVETQAAAGRASVGMMMRSRPAATVLTMLTHAQPWRTNPDHPPTSHAVAFCSIRHTSGSFAGTCSNSNVMPSFSGAPAGNLGRTNLSTQVKQ